MNFTDHYSDEAAQKRGAELRRFYPQYSMSILHSLGLSWLDLEGKKTLEIGTGSGYLAYAAQEDGVDVTAIDNGEEDPLKWYGHTFVPQLRQYVRADVRRLPFPDNHFDYAISHLAPPLHELQQWKEVRIAIDEIIRTLKPNGELRSIPDFLSGKYMRAVAMTDKQKDAVWNRNYEHMVNVTRKKSHQLLRTAYPLVQFKNFTRGEPDSISSGCAIFTKSEP